MSIESPKYRRRLALLWRSDFVGRAAFPPAINAYVCNVLVAFYRERLAY